MITDQGLVWGDASPSPHSHLVRYWAGSQSLGETAARTVAGVTGALASYSVMAALWTWDLSHFHDNREVSTAASHCAGDLQVRFIIMINKINNTSGLRSPYPLE